MNFTLTIEIVLTQSRISVLCHAFYLISNWHFPFIAMLLNPSVNESITNARKKKYFAKHNTRQN